MIYLNFNTKKNDLKNSSRNNTPNNQFTNKSIEIHYSSNKNNLIEFSSPNIKEIKKRNNRTNSYNIYCNHNKTEGNQFTSNYLMNQNKNFKSFSKGKEHFNSFSNVPTKQNDIQNMKKKKSNYEIPNIKNEIISLKGFFQSVNFIGNKLIKAKIKNENKLQKSYIPKKSKLNINFNNLSNNNTSKKFIGKKNNYLINSYDNYSMNNIGNSIPNYQSNTLKLSKEQIKFKIDEINNQISELINQANEYDKEFIYNELGKNYCSIINNQNQDSLNDIINNLFKDNQILKHENNELNKNLEKIENLLKMICQDNKLLKNNLLTKDLEIKELQNTMNNLSKVFQSVKNENNNLLNTKDENKNLSRSNLDDTVNISLAENININPEYFKNKHIMISNDSSKTNPSSKLNLNFEKNNDFNDEFLDNYNDFSPSWRKEADKIIKKNK